MQSFVSSLPRLARLRSLLLTGGLALLLFAALSEGARAGDPAAKPWVSWVPTGKTGCLC
jgi:hypothetical protein